MKEIWMRMGVRVSVSEEELFQLMERAHEEYLYCRCRNGLDCREDGMDDCNLTRSESEEFFNRAKPDGDCYIPESCFDEHLRWYLKQKENNHG